MLNVLSLVGRWDTVLCLTHTERAGGLVAKITERVRLTQKVLSPSPGFV